MRQLALSAESGDRVLLQYVATPARVPGPGRAITCQIPANYLELLGALFVLGK